MSAESSYPHEPSRAKPSEVVSGYLAAISMAASLVSLAWHTLRLSPPAMLLAIVSALMAGRGKRLQLAATIVAAVCFFLGMTISVVVSRPLW